MNENPWIFCFIDGTILDDRHRINLPNKGFDRLDLVEKDKPVPGSIETLNLLARKYNIFYMSARKDDLRELTVKWLKEQGYPDGEVYFGDTHEKRMGIVKELKKKRNIIAGIGDRWDDNEMHLEIGCKSIILKEYEGNWNRIKKWLL